MKYLIYWLSFGVSSRRGRDEDVRVMPGHTREDEQSFARRMAFYRLHPHH